MRYHLKNRGESGSSLSEPIHECQETTEKKCRHHHYTMSEIDISLRLSFPALPLHLYAI